MLAGGFEIDEQAYWQSAYAVISHLCSELTSRFMYRYLTSVDRAGFSFSLHIEALVVGGCIVLTSTAGVGAFLNNDLPLYLVNPISSNANAMGIKPASI